MVGDPTTFNSAQPNEQIMGLWLFDRFNQHTILHNVDYKDREHNSTAPLKNTTSIQKQ